MNEEEYMGLCLQSDFTLTGWSPIEACSRRRQSQSQTWVFRLQLCRNSTLPTCDIYHVHLYPIFPQSIDKIASCGGTFKEI